jgi:tetratricopeptide (TPR) repeat protein
MWSLILIRTWAQTTPYAELRTTGRTEYRAGHFASAEGLLRAALDTASAAGDNNATAAIDNDLGDVYVGEERLHDAEQAYSRSLTLLKTITNKPFETAAVLRNLGSVYALERRYDEALKALNEASKLTRTLKNPESRSLTAEILNSEGIVFFRKEQFGKARGLFEQAMQVRADAGLGDSLGDAQTLNNIGMIYLKQHRYGQAEGPFVRSVDITVRILGPAHPDVALTLANLGEVYTETGRYRQGMDQYEQCLNILRTATPPLDGRIARTLQLVASNYLKQRDKIGAEHALAEAIERVRRTSVTDDPEIPALFDSYANLLKSIGKLDEARQAYAEAKRIRAAIALTVRVPMTK